MSKYLKDNFSVSKSGIPFTSIGSDQVSGGVIGLTQKPLALNRFCLTAPILNATSNKYCKSMILGNAQRENLTINSLVHT